MCIRDRGPLSLHHQFAALVENKVGLFLLGRKPGIGNIAKLVVTCLQPGLQGSGLIVA